MHLGCRHVLDSCPLIARSLDGVSSTAHQVWTAPNTIMMSNGPMSLRGAFCVCTHAERRVSTGLVAQHIQRSTANGHFCGSTSRTSSYLVDLTRDAVRLCACWGSRAGVDTNDKDPDPRIPLRSSPLLALSAPCAPFSIVSGTVQRHLPWGDGRVHR